MKSKLQVALLLGLMTAGFGCQPQTPAQKVEDAAEDAAHEVEQGTERMKENVQDAPN